MGLSLPAGPVRAFDRVEDPPSDQLNSPLSRLASTAAGFATIDLWTPVPDASFYQIRGADMQLSVRIAVAVIGVSLAGGAEVSASSPIIAVNKQAVEWSADLVRQLFQSGRSRPGEREERYRWDTICAAAHHVSSEELDAGGDRLMSAWLASTRDAGVDPATSNRDRNSVSQLFLSDRVLTRVLPPGRVKQRCVAALG